MDKVGTPKPAKGTWAEGTARANTWCREQSLGHEEDSPPSVTVLSGLAGRGGRQATTVPRSCPYPRSTPRESTYMQPSPFRCGLVEPAEAKAGREGSCNRGNSHRPAPCWRHRGTGGQLRRGGWAGQPSDRSHKLSNAAKKKRSPSLSTAPHSLLQPEPPPPDADRALSLSCLNPSMAPKSHP